MNAIPVTRATVDIARRVIWFESPETALANPVQFMAYAMTYARHEDMRVIRQFVSDDDFREALDNAPPGIFDPRSWAYWNVKMGRSPPPPLPRRTFGSTADRDRARTTDPEEVRRQAREQWLARYGPSKGG